MHEIDARQNCDSSMGSFQSEHVGHDEPSQILIKHL